MIVIFPAELPSRANSSILSGNGRPVCILSSSIAAERIGREPRKPVVVGFQEPKPTVTISRYEMLSSAGRVNVNIRVSCLNEIDMQKAQPMARTAQNQSDLLATETRQFTDVSEMTEAYRGRADVRFIQNGTWRGTATSRLTSIGPLQIQQFSWTGKLITEAANASNRTTLFIPEPQERPAFISGEHLNDAQVMLYGPNSEHFSDMSGRSRATQLFLPEGMLEQAIAARLQNDPMNLASKRRLLNPGRVAMHSLRQLIVELTQIIDNDEDAGVESVCTSSLIKQSSRSHCRGSLSRFIAGIDGA